MIVVACSTCAREENEADVSYYVGALWTTYEVGGVFDRDNHLMYIRKMLASSILQMCVVVRSNA